MPLIVKFGGMSDTKRNYNVLAAYMLQGISKGSRHWTCSHYIEADKIITNSFSTE